MTVVDEQFAQSSMSALAELTRNQMHSFTIGFGLGRALRVLAPRARQTQNRNRVSARPRSAIYESLIQRHPLRRAPLGAPAPVECSSRNKAAPEARWASGWKCFSTAIGKVKKYQEHKQRKYGRKNEEKIRGTNAKRKALEGGRHLLYFGVPLVWTF